MTTTKKLIPLGTRVSHWNGSGHGKGTIIAYNNIPENSYLRQNFGDAVNLAAQAGNVLLGGLVNSMYDGGRYPYVVQWDPRVAKEGDSEQNTKMRLKYPRGYKDVYTGSPDDSELTLIDEPSIFPNDTIRRLGRCWENNQWSNWAEVTDDGYAMLQENKEVIENWQFCVR